MRTKSVDRSTLGHICSSHSLHLVHNLTVPSSRIPSMLLVVPNDQTVFSVVPYSLFHSAIVHSIYHCLFGIVPGIAQCKLVLKCVICVYNQSFVSSCQVCQLIFSVMIIRFHLLLEKLTIFLLMKCFYHIFFSFILYSSMYSTH